jgi:serine protease Do
MSNRPFFALFNRLSSLALVGALVSAAGIGGWMVIAQTRRSAEPDLSNLRVVKRTEGMPASPAVDLSNIFKRVTKAVKPSVVSIRVVETVSNDLFRNGHPAVPGMEDGMKQRGTGSGFIISPDGYIVTNDHVVGKADKIEVTLDGGRDVTAKLVGADPQTDLAVIKIDEAGLPPVTLGNPDEMEQGDWVMAIGSPFGLQQTITVGVISATGRDLPSTRTTRYAQYNRYLQTDASINPGNSGGPLVNLRGEVVGVNTMILSESGGSEGVGFAIPSDLVSKVCRKLILEGRVRRGWLGVSLRTKPMTTEEAKAYKLPSNEGALIQDTTSDDSPAAKGGIKAGDFIVTFDGTPVRNEKDLTTTVAETEIGKPVTVELIRDGKPTKVQVTIAERPSNLSQATAAPEKEKNEKPRPSGLLGLTVTPLTPDLASRLKPRQSDGVVIDTVVAGGPSDEAGLRKGMILHSLNKQPVTSPESFQKLLADLKPGSVVIIAVEVQVEGRWEYRYPSIIIE